ncbi:hypothetical protein ASG12_17775 [Williamsia sp. Leaf354]|nr:hypothetical protein ASG12_17775 [Williamsia sp. Leaf354]
MSERSAPGQLDQARIDARRDGSNAQRQMNSVDHLRRGFAGSAQDACVRWSSVAALARRSAD